MPATVPELCTVPNLQEPPKTPEEASKRLAIGIREAFKMLMAILLALILLLILLLLLLFG